MEQNKPYTLIDFLSYAEKVLQESNTFFLIALLAEKDGLSPQTLMVDVEACFMQYFQYLKEAQDKEMYECCALINKALVKETKHYQNLAKVVLKHSMVVEIDLIISKLKNKYLGI